MRKMVRRVNVRNLEKIQDKWLLFQRFVTSIVVDIYIQPLQIFQTGKHIVRQTFDGVHA